VVCPLSPHYLCTIFPIYQRSCGKKSCGYPARQTRVFHMARSSSFFFYSSKTNLTTSMSLEERPSRSYFPKHQTKHNMYESRSLPSPDTQITSLQIYDLEYGWCSLELSRPHDYVRFRSPTSHTTSSAFHSPKLGKSNFMFVRRCLIAIHECWKSCLRSTKSKNFFLMSCVREIYLKTSNDLCERTYATLTI